MTHGLVLSGLLGALIVKVVGKVQVGHIACSASGQGGAWVKLAGGGEQGILGVHIHALDSSCSFRGFGAAARHFRGAG